jgi:hypothetical protein
MPGKKTCLVEDGRKSISILVILIKPGALRNAPIGIQKHLNICSAKKSLNPFFGARS